MDPGPFGRQSLASVLVDDVVFLDPIDPRLRTVFMQRRDFVIDHSVPPAVCSESTKNTINSNDLISMMVGW